MDKVEDYNPYTRDALMQQLDAALDTDMIARVARAKTEEDYKREAEKIQRIKDEIYAQKNSKKTEELVPDDPILIK